VGKRGLKIRVRMKKKINRKENHVHLKGRAGECGTHGESFAPTKSLIWILKKIRLRGTVRSRNRHSGERAKGSSERAKQGLSKGFE